MTRTRVPLGDKLERGSISLPREHWEALAAVSRQRDRSMSALVRQAVDEFLTRRPREVERALSEITSDPEPVAALA